MTNTSPKTLYHYSPTFLCATLPLCYVRGVIREEASAESIKEGGSGCVSRSVIEEAIGAEIQSQPLVSSIDYISIGSKSTLSEVDVVVPEEGAVIAIALRLGDIRLLDNVVI